MHTNEEMKKLASTFIEACNMVDANGNSTFIKLWVADGRFHFAILHPDISKQVDSFIKNRGN